MTLLMAMRQRIVVIVVTKLRKQKTADRGVNMEKEFNITEKKDGYLYEIKGTTRVDGEYICKNTEEYTMLEKIGEALLGYKITVVRK